jgi:hypothetical protein
MGGVRTHNRRTQTETTGGDPAQRVIIGDQPIDVNGTFTAGGAENPRNTNLALTAATENGHAMVAGLKKITFRSRISTPIKFAWVNGETATKFITLEANCSFSEDALNFTGKTIYFLSPVATTIEIIEYYT